MFIVERKNYHEIKHYINLGRNNAIWNVVLIVYTQVAATLTRLSDCRPYGFNIHDLPGGRECIGLVHKHVRIHFI